MTRTRKPAGHISFVGAGPGDPGLVTRRAWEALSDADHVVFDRGVPDTLLAALRGGTLLKITIQDTNKRTINIDVPLLGFGLAYDKMIK